MLLIQTWAGKEIVFEKEEIQNMRKIGKHGLHVLGFKPRSAAVKAWYHVRNSQFIYPNEERVKGIIQPPILKQIKQEWLYNKI